jgi:hypothetical protein
MLRYYFHIRDRAGLILDEEGAVFPGDDGALLEARRSAEDFASNRPSSRTKTHPQSVEVWDERGNLLFVVPIGTVH